MLISDSTYHFVVCPPWPGYEPIWARMSAQASIGCGELLAAVRSGCHAEVIARPVLAATRGAFGGGVICMFKDDLQASLPLREAMSREDLDLPCPPGVGHDLNVSFFRPRVKKLMQTPEAGWVKLNPSPQKTAAMLEKYACPTSFEHFESKGEYSYWIIVLKRKSPDDVITASLSRIAKGFGIAIRHEADPLPTDVSDDILRVFGSKRRLLVYSVELNHACLELNFSYLVYSAYHLASVPESPLSSMHLCGAIAGKPSISPKWYNW